MRTLFVRPRPRQPAAAYHPTRAEQETILRFDRADPELSVWSASPVTWRRMAKLGIAPVRETTCQGRVSGRFYRLPLARFRWGLKRVGVPAPGRRVAVRTAA